MKPTLLAISIILFGLHQVSTPDADRDKELWRRARKIHDEAIVVDAHAHPFIFSVGSEHWNLGQDTPFSQIDLVKMKKGGVDVALYALPLRLGRGQPNHQRLEESSKKLKAMLHEHQALAMPAFTIKQIRKAVGQGKRAIVFSVECPDVYDGDAEKVKTYYDMGYRSMVLSPSKKDVIADTKIKDPLKEGISTFGRQVVAMMNKHGVIIDITHAGDQLQLDIIRASRTPVIASHSCGRTLSKWPRGIPDRVIQALARRGGVVCVTFGSSHVEAGYSKAFQASMESFKPIEEKMKKKYQNNPEKLNQAIKMAKARHIPKQPPVEKLIDHIDHIVMLVGADHVGLGSDYGGDFYYYIQELKDASTWPLITYHLLKRGYQAKDIKKILGGNVLKVMAQVEKNRE